MSSTRSMSSDVPRADALPVREASPCVSRLAAALAAGLGLALLLSDAVRGQGAAPSPRALAPGVEAAVAPPQGAGAQPAEVVRVRLEDPGRSPYLGSAKARVTITAFTDYQCPFCKRAEATLEDLLDTYGDDLRIVVKQCPLDIHRDAELAAQAALAANLLGEFPAMHKLLFARQADLSREGLLEVAVSAGLDREAFAAALDSGEFARDVRADMELAKRLGISSTPFFLVNGRPIRGAKPFSAFQAFIDQELQGTAGSTRWVDKVERPEAGSKGPDAPSREEENARLAQLLEQVRRASTPDKVTEILLLHIANLEDEVQDLHEELRELRRNLVTVAASQQRGHVDAAVRAETQRDRIVTVGDVPLSGYPSRGKEEAKLGIMVFGDFACPYTRKFVRYTLPSLLQRYVDTGRARYFYRSRPLDYNVRSLDAAVAASCGGDQGAFWQMHDALFAIESTLEKTDFVAMARDLGLDEAKFKACVADPDRAREIGEDLDNDEIERLGLRVVPTLLIGTIQGDHLVNAKRVSGVQTLRVLGAVVESILGE